MSPRYLLPRLVPTMLIALGVSGIWKDDHGVKGTISAVGYFSFVALALAVIVTLAAAGVRRARRPAES